MIATRTARRLAFSCLMVGGAMCATTPVLQAESDDDGSAAFEKAARRWRPGMTVRERDEEAARNGRLEIRESVRLHGLVLASSVHVAPGADVVVDDDLYLYSTGPIHIEAPIRAAASEARGRLKAGGIYGAAGGKGNAIVMRSAADVTIDAAVVGNAGQDGESVTHLDEAYGGAGGDGGDVTIAADDGTVTINASISAARGGAGGSATAPSLGDAHAVGGRGGASGDLSIFANTLALGPNAAINLPPPSRGGDATATGGDGRIAQCYDPASDVDGGNAAAWGGRCGFGGKAHVSSIDIDLDAFARAVASDAPPRGGDAWALGADGSGIEPGRCENTDCPDRGRRGIRGGRGGNAKAVGGDGAFGTKVEARDYRHNVYRQFETSPSDGGSAAAYAGSGARGENGERARFPGRGGAGGSMGSATATAGHGGLCRIGVGPLGVAIHGGRGGDAHVNDGLGVPHPGDGGNGGDCCDNPGHRGAPGGKAGVRHVGHATAGRGGRCRKGVDGDIGVAHGGDVPTAVDGAKGADCPPPVAATFTASATSVTITTAPGADGSKTITVTNTSDQPQTLDIGHLTGHFFNFPNGQVVFQAGETKTITIGHSAPSAVTESVNLLLMLVGGAVQATIRVTGITK